MPFSPESVAARTARRTKGAAAPADLVPISARPRRPGPAPAAGRTAAPAATRDLVFKAGAEAFARSGFDGVGVDDIARAAGVNKAMLYYHFKNKLELYREVVRDMLHAVTTAVTAIVESDVAPPAKIERFIETLATMREARPWFPPLMMREMSAGAPHLDPATLLLLRGVFTAFGRILEQGVQSGHFRKVHPVLAYVTILGPMMMNAVRERAAAEPGRAHLPMFALIPRKDLIAHMQHTALSMLAKDTIR
ncbi:MAG: TetR family transcriptional regulator [Acidobacteria bacterium]|nr:TetR family transcriptional regulator [Acidobacteriota bacterium]